MMQKIFMAQKYLVEAVSNMSQFQSSEKITIKEIYLKLRGAFPKVHRRKIICNNIGAPKWIFILFLAIHGRLYTKDRLLKWGVTDNSICPLCEVEDESIDHLFFKYELSNGVWCKLLRWQGTNRPVMRWADAVVWMVANVNGKSAAAKMFRAVLAAAVYILWQERNQRVFQGKKRTERVLTRLIIQETICQASKSAPLAGRLRELNFYPQC
ncbi:uncharacterized protein LOC132636576 [Lycium barbarum]|uniref:uncharacterized protein LOC132636576 n=1 Tax=Lycium barbarum TaxID=112863 RepID=UPI00293F39A8|nr:uncharacterized protein LOC132636576 [Lycium barbarum]